MPVTFSQQMSTTPHILSGQIVDIPNRRVYGGEVVVREGRIEEIRPVEPAPPHFILPGFIDAHVHIESSMLAPSEFARIACTHGTVATVSDPHEIANVLGVAGVDFMIRNGRETPFKFYFGAPSCVPATSFETAGARLGPQEIESLMQRAEIKYLAEMMNWPGVIHGDKEVLEKIAIARRHGKPVDGHAPGLSPDQAIAYIRAGISTDHECVSLDEAKNKLAHGMKIIIREGSAARNFEALVDLLIDHEDQVMFCSDDKHPDSLEEGHINDLVRRAVAKGMDVFRVLKAACVNPVLHYGLNVGLLRPGDPADFIAVTDLTDFKVKYTLIDGVMVAKNGMPLIPGTAIGTPNNFHADRISERDVIVEAKGSRLRVIVAHDGQLITSGEIVAPPMVGNQVVCDVSRDILKLVVMNRYMTAPPAVAFIRGFGLQQGALASSVAHDSHNIIAVGCDDASIVQAINEVIESRGGVSAVHDGHVEILALPIAGIMSDQDGYKVANQYRALDQLAKKMGSNLGAPFMTLSFMALLVIPSLKLSDKGLFDGGKFEFVPVTFQ